MTQIRLILADKDSMFLEKLSSYIQKNKTTRFSLELFTSSINLESWLEKGEKADMMAISSTLFSEMTKKPENKNILILSDNAESLLPQGYNSIHKYKPAENLMKEILSLCAENIPQSILKKEHSGQVHLVLYIDGSDAANPIAQAMAGVMSKNQGSTFYVNLDELSNTDTWFSGNNTKGLSEMLYYVKAQKENLSLKAESCISKDFETGVDFMKGHKNPEDIGKLSAVECENYIDAIRGRDCCTNIILSRAFHHDALLPVLLKEADKIYMTSLDYPSSIERLSKAANLLSDFEEQNNLDFKNKVIICITPFRRDQKPQAVDILCYQKAYLPFPFEEGASFLSASSEYQTVLKTILEKGFL